MDSIDEIERQNNRNLETTEMVSAYMRANAQRAAQKKAQARVEPEVKKEETPKEAESDKLDFSSEFTTGDMGLSSQGESGILDWKRKIEDEEEERRRKEEDDEQAEEWKSGAWGDKEGDGEQPEEAPEDEESTEAEDSPESSVAPPPPAPAYVPPTASVAPVLAEPEADAPKPAPSQAGSAALASPPPADPSSWSQETVEKSAAPPPVIPRPAVVNEQGAVTSFSVAERLRPAAEAELPVSGQLAQIDPVLAMVAGNLIATPAQEPGYEECVRLLSRFGMGGLTMCAREKVRVEILDEADFVSHPALRAMGLSPDETPVDGAYLVERRLVLVDRRCLVARPRFFHPALYYFAHAFDHAQGGDTFSSRKAAAVVACFEASTRAYNGFDFVDELAAADPVRYFARSVAVYLGRDDCSDPLWSHQDLYDFDRSMYDYLQYLFARLGQ